jgi:hypothetical protein
MESGRPPFRQPQKPTKEQPLDQVFYDSPGPMSTSGRRPEPVALPEAAARPDPAPLGTRESGESSAALDEAFSAFVGAGIGLALASALGALLIRRCPPLLSGLLAGIAAYVLLLAPALMYTDDVSLSEDLGPGGLGVLGLLLARLASSL